MSPASLAKVRLFANKYNRLNLKRSIDIKYAMGPKFPVLDSKSEYYNVDPKIFTYPFRKATLINGIPVAVVQNLTYFSNTVGFTIQPGATSVILFDNRRSSLPPTNTDQNPCGPKQKVETQIQWEGTGGIPTPMVVVVTVYDHNNAIIQTDYSDPMTNENNNIGVAQATAINHISSSQFINGFTIQFLNLSTAAAQRCNIGDVKVTEDRMAPGGLLNCYMFSGNVTSTTAQLMQLVDSSLLKFEFLPRATDANVATYRGSYTEPIGDPAHFMSVVDTVAKLNRGAGYSHDYVVKYQSMLPLFEDEFFEAFSFGNFMHNFLGFLSKAAPIAATVGSAFFPEAAIPLSAPRLSKALTRLMMNTGTPRTSATTSRATRSGGQNQSIFLRNPLTSISRLGTKVCTVTSIPASLTPWQPSSGATRYP